MDETELIREAMRALGKRKSERKTLSCRANAKLPRKRPIGDLNAILKIDEIKASSKPLALTVPQDLPSNPNESPS